MGHRGGGTDAHVADRDAPFPKPIREPGHHRSFPLRDRGDFLIRLGVVGMARMGEDPREVDSGRLVQAGCQRDGPSGLRVYADPAVATVHLEPNVRLGAPDRLDRVDRLIGVHDDAEPDAASELRGVRRPPQDQRIRPRDVLEPVAREHARFRERRDREPRRTELPLQPGDFHTLVRLDVRAQSHAEPIATLCHHAEVALEDIQVEEQHGCGKLGSVRQDHAPNLRSIMKDGEPRPGADAAREEEIAVAASWCRSPADAILRR